MSILVPSTAKYEIARSIYRDIINGNDNFFIFAGKTIKWDTLDIVPTVIDDTRKSLAEIHKNILFVNKVASGLNDVVFMIRRVDWESGTPYVQYKDNENLEGENFYIVTDQFRIYKCLSNNNGAASTVKPTSTSVVDSSISQLSDGYIWAFLYEIPVIDRERFMTTEFIPVRHVSDNMIFDVNGTVNKIEIIDGGFDYQSPTVVLEGDGTGAAAYIDPDDIDINGTVQKVTITEGAGGSGYSFCNIKLVDDLGQGFKGTVVLQNETENITNQDVVKNTIPGAIYKVDIVTAGSGYSIAPVVTVVGDGTGAKINVTIDNTGAINNVIVSSPGENYSYARIELNGGTPDVPAELSANVGPQGGHGNNVVRELFADTLCICSSLSEQNTDLFVGNDVRQLGLLKNINKYDSIELFTKNTGTASSIIEVVEEDYNKFTEDDEVRSSNGGKYIVAAKVYDSIDDTYFVYLSYTEGSQLLSTLSKFDNLTNYAANIPCISVTLPEVDKTSGSVMYVNNLSPITRSSEQVETVKLFLNF